MKAERRHELQTNELALWIRWRAPQLLEKYGTKILLGVVFLVLLIVLLRYRLNAPKQAAQIAADNLMVARSIIMELNATVRPPGQAAQAAKLINDALEQAESYSLTNLQAEAYLTLGDYYWALASFPDIPQAATQPILRPDQPRDVLLTSAGEAYAKVLSLQSEHNHRWAAAHLGQAAVAEQQAFELMRSAKSPSTQPATESWAKAREHYQTVAAADKIPQVLKDEAKRHIDELPQLQQPLYLAAPSPTTQSATQPAPMMGPTTVPAATQPAK
jgi:tetratricopeptide (TPR) repeat protein